MENNHREYCEEAVEHLLIMKEVQATGFTLAEFKELDEACNAAHELVTEKAATFIRRKIAEVCEKRAELSKFKPTSAANWQKYFRKTTALLTYEPTKG